MAFGRNNRVVGAGLRIATEMSSNIWVAAADNKIDEVKALIGSGEFSANSADPNGFTPIHAAASYGNIELLHYLLTNGGDVNVQDSDGDTPLHHTESIEVARLLVKEFGANYRIKNNEGLNVKEYFIEEDEFPELINFFTILEKTGDIDSLELNGNSAGETTDISGVLPNGQSIKAFLSSDNNELDSAEVEHRRKQVEQIFADKDLSEAERDEKLREYVLGVVSDNMSKLKDTNNEHEDDADHKRKR